MRHIPRDSWAIIERVIRRYPETREEYDKTLLDVIGGHSEEGGSSGGVGIGRPTEMAVIMLHSERMERMRREIAAVSSVYDAMAPEHQKVIRLRFWMDRYRNTPYEQMFRSTSYSEVQMKRIVGRFVRKVGERLGEIEVDKR